ncbi:MAG: YghX family hydrolase [Rhodospirillaceae bacterium]
MNALSPLRSPRAARRKTAQDFPQELLDLYDFYAHGRLSRREFLDRAAKFTIAGVTASMLLTQLSPNYAWALQVDPDDPEISTVRISYPSPEGTADAINAYLCRPAGASGPLPGILVIHENRGLNPYIEDVTRRMAKAGFLALAPDGLTSKGGYPGNDDDGRALQREVDRAQLLTDFFNAFEFLRDHPDCTGKVGAIGFCYGGGVVNALAVAYPDLAAGVPFYGRQPAAEDVPAIQAPLMIVNAELDQRINEGWPAYEAALKANNKEFEAFMYPGVNHGFHNDTTPRFDAAAAKLAEDRAIAFFKKHVTS